MNKDNNKELEGIETETLIDMLADSTARYTRLLLTDPNGEEFTKTRDVIVRLQVILGNRTEEQNEREENRGSDRA